MDRKGAHGFRTSGFAGCICESRLVEERIKEGRFLLLQKSVADERFIPYSTAW